MILYWKNLSVRIRASTTTKKNTITVVNVCKKEKIGHYVNLLIQ